jgi:hypothetical protein
MPTPPRRNEFQLPEPEPLNPVPKSPSAFFLAIIPLPIAALIIGGIVLVVHGYPSRPLGEALAVPLPNLEQAQQEWTTAAPVASFATMTNAGKLPAVDNRQLLAPCDPDLYVTINGACWIPLALEKCPKGKAFEHEGKCYARALRAERVPQSGEPRASSVANPP